MDDLDPQLVAAARLGDLHAFETIVRRFQPAVWRLCVHLLHDESLAEDVTQEAFVRVYRFLPRYRGDAKLSTWVFSVARNCAMDELRRAGRRRRTDDRVGVERSAEPDSSVAVEVREALMHLPLQAREPLVWIDMFGMSYAEAAAMLGMPVGTLKSRVHYARKQLAEVLAVGAEGETHEA